jgi:hypothetical protein
MIKLYDLILEAEVTRLRNNLDLGDKNEEFQEKLDTMSPGDQNVLVPFVRRLIRRGDSRIEEFKNLLNRFSKVEDLKAPKTPLEREIAALEPGTAGPGELLFHLELQDSNMDVGDKTNHDLIVKGKVWEVKKVDGIEKGVRRDKQPITNFRLAKKGRASKFKFNTDLLKTVILLDKIIKNSNVEDDLSDISPRLQTALDLWQERISKSPNKPDGNSPKEAILQGDHSQGFRKIMIKLINIIKSEIEVNTDDEFTNVRFGGVNVVPKEMGIDPISTNNVSGDDDSITLNFIGKSTLKAIEILNDLPYARDADFINDMDDAVMEALEDMPSMIIWGDKDGKILIVEKDKFNDVFEFSSVTQGNLIIKIKDEVWKKA